MKKIAVITGTTHGIGRVTALELARHRWHVVMLCRDLPRARQLGAEIEAQVPESRVDSLHCDLGLLDTVRSCAALLREHYPPISLLINNAGIADLYNRRTLLGHDLNFTVNHLGHFLLTELLRCHLTMHARIVIVASRAHFRGHIDFNSLTDRRERIAPARSYARSKLANVLHCMALSRRLEGSSVTVNCLHPGVVATHLLPGLLVAVRPLFGTTVLSEHRGAETTLHLALSPVISGVSGSYYDEHCLPQTPATIACSIELQETLWQRSLDWVDVAPAR